jgi:hypothetical protein
VNPSITIRNAIVNENTATATTPKISLARKLMISFVVDAGLSLSLRAIQDGYTKGFRSRLFPASVGLSTGCAVDFTKV